MAKLTLAISSHRPHRWTEFCSHAMKNCLDMEIIFVGPFNDEHVSIARSLPIKARLFNTDVNPTRCWEIGARNAQSDFLCFTCDDFYYSAGFFDAAVRLANKKRCPFDMFTGRYLNNDSEQIAGCMMCGHIDMPLLPVGGVVYTEDHHALGGIDRRFLATLWDSDLYMRAFCAGGRTTLLPGHTTHESKLESTMLTRYCHLDHPTILNLWFNGATPHLNRTSPVQSFSKEETTVPELHV